MAKNTKDTIEYTYYGFNSITNSKVSITLRPGDEKADGGRFTEEEIIFLRDADHSMALEDRYWKENQDPLFQVMKRMDPELKRHDRIVHKQTSLIQFKTDPAYIVTEARQQDDEEDDARLERLLELLKTLSQDEADMYHEIYEKHMSMREYARKIGKCDGTVRYRLKRFHERLRKSM